VRRCENATCADFRRPLFGKRKFDYCIVDEASQITLPTCLGPLRFADKFVLVGDHNQLPPLVRNPAARKGGLDISLFRRLSEAQPDAIVYLAQQYRMNADVMALSNTLVYEGKLRCGNEAVATRALSVPNLQALERHDGDCWLRHLVDPRCAVAARTAADGAVARSSSSTRTRCRRARRNTATSYRT